MRRTAAATLLISALFLPACSKKADSSIAPGAALATRETPMATPSATLQPSAPSGIQATLSERLVVEAHNRPHIQPNADDILATLAKAGAGVAAKKQGLGATFKASFCKGGTTADGWVTVSICEYDSDESAKAGLAALQAIYPRKLARHVLHKTTVLTTMRLQDGTAAEEIEAKMIDTYNAL
jgi:hypothetical protein